MTRTLILALLAAGTTAGPVTSRAGTPDGAEKPVPRMQAEPLPRDEVALLRDGGELARCHFGRDLIRPYIYPLIGPSGRSLTRMGHPHDPESHAHHTSVWIAHRDVNGLNFWENGSGNRIVHQRIEGFADGEDEASVRTLNAWTAGDGTVLLIERRRVGAHGRPGREWLLVIDIELAAKDRAVTLGKSPFGLIGVRMAKSIGVNDGGGTIRNSEGGVNETGVFWRPARWVDYAGPIALDVSEGITLMDHPSNPNHPSVFHVRNDGWMGAALTFAAPLTIQPGKPLRLRYGLHVHAGLPPRDALQTRWTAFSRTKPGVFHGTPAGPEKPRPEPPEVPH